MRVVQKVSPTAALAHFRRGGMVSFLPDGNNAFTRQYDDENIVRRMVSESPDQVYIVTGTSTTEVRDKLLHDFPLHQILTINGTEYAVRKILVEDGEMCLSLEARENQPYIRRSVRVSLTVWED